MTVADPTNEWYTTRQQSVVTARPRRGVVLHHGATTSMDAIIQMETSGSRQVSSNRVVKDARCARIVSDDPNVRAWSLSSPYYDSVLSSVECANESTAGWTISAASHETLARMVAFWAQRDGFYPHRTGDPKGWTVFGHREIYTIFGASYATACPGGMDLNWITNRAQQLLAEGNTNGDTMLYIWTPAVGSKKARYALTDPFNIPGGYITTDVYDEALDYSRIATAGGTTTGAPQQRSAAEFDASLAAAAKFAKLWQTTGPLTPAQIAAIADAIGDELGTTLASDADLQKVQAAIIAKIPTKLSGTLTAG